MKKEMNSWNVRRLPLGTAIKMVRNGESGGTTYYVIRKGTEKWLRSKHFGQLRKIEDKEGYHYELANFETV